MIVILIIYILCLAPAIYFTKYGLENGFNFHGMSKILIFLSVWLITPAFLFMLLWSKLKKLFSK